MNDSTKITFNICQKAIEIDRFCADAYFFKGLAYYEQNDFLEAIKTIDSAIEIDPFVDIYSISKADSYSCLGITYFNNNDFYKALECFDKSIEMDSFSSDYFINKVFMYQYKAFFYIRDFLILT